MNKKTVGIAILVVGVVILGLSLLADVLRIGSGEDSFGPVQIAGTVVGAVLIAVAVFLHLKQQPSKSESSTPQE